MSHISDILCSIRNMKIISLSGAIYLMRKALRLTGLITWSIDGRICTYLDLGPPVPLGGSAKEKSSSVYGDPAGSMPADTMTNFFFESASPCLLQPPLLSSAIFWHPVHCRNMFGCFTLLSEDVVSHFSSTPCTCCNNVLESLHACHHIFICRMVVPFTHDYALVRFYHIIHAKVIHSLGPALVVGERGA